MDFHLKQWTDHHHDSSSSSPALSLFSSEPTSTKPSPPKMVQGVGGYFSMGQWQELEVQALIYKHMLTGSPVPPQLLHLLLNSTSSFYSLPTFTPSLYQTGGGYWGRGGMDPEPGRCRRTDGKKWRCSRDVVAGHKYCERHIHRGRNRSRKPVEIPTPAAAAAAGTRGGGGGGYGGGLLKTSSSSGGAQPYTATAAGGGGGGATHSGGGLSGHLHLNQRTSESTIENKATTYRSPHNEMLENDDNSASGRVLRPFFDDWPRTVQEQETRATSLSISVQGNSSSDFSLKLSTGDSGPREEEINERAPLNWGMLWGTHHAGSTGGPLAEALRSSATTMTSSPTSVLHQLQRGSTTTSETSYVST